MTCRRRSLNSSLSKMSHPLDVLPQLVELADGWKIAADLSTCHLTKGDSDLLAAGALSCVGPFEYGWVIRTNYERAELKDTGFSDSYCYMLHILNGNGVAHAYFDCDAPVWPDFATHQ